MPKEKFPILYISLFCFLLLIVFLCGYIGFLQHGQWEGPNVILYGSIFSVVLIFAFIFFRRIVLSFNEEIEARYKLQKAHLNQLRQIYEGTLQALAKALDFRDHGTWGHSARVVGYALAIGEKMNLEEEQLRRLAWGGFLHDIGKIGVSDAVLLKSSELTREEWLTIQMHPSLGYDIISGIEFLKESADIILLHHERYDGKGYPYGLANTEIPLLARIFAVADALDAMTSDRPYRPARSVEMALEEIKKQSGRQFCPESVQALLSVGKDQVCQIQERVKREGAHYDFYKETIPFNGFDLVSE